MMKIVQIFPGKVWGGAEQYVLDLGRALSAMGHEVKYLCRDAAAVTCRLEKEGIEFHAVGKGLAGLVDGADIVHIHDSHFVGPTVKAARRCEKKPDVVLTRHIARGSRVMPWKRGCYRSLAAMIFVSDLSKRLWTEANRWMPAEKCIVVHNSIPPAEENAGGVSLRELYGIGEKTPIVMFTGRIRKSKGCEEIIKALGRQSGDWAMVFVGATKPKTYSDTLMAEARRLGIDSRIHFYGFTPDVRQLIVQSDIGVQPSIVREAFGLSQLEFMQAGKALITTDNGAQPEYIDNGRTGLLVPPADTERLAESLSLLLNDKALRERMGKAAEEEYRRELSYDVFLNKIIQLYNQVLKQ